ncbi:RNA polymerase sigma factor [Chitinophaga sp. 22321]|uniref:Sigma-70 family RNA polymerase sigma factor n=1 Tax=Chitinophaga hostae TaxID=2831022 RepID=A0ABS5IYZ3_9BACT|nr:sigma-70 family RNA polymerase sigma factor [Chitinophaga hostae]MBS0028186.1 sigma-70 family RNA polymerase sigma factor [Chitinophaga hostae]
MSMDDDAHAWEGLCSGEKEALLLLYRKYYHALLFIGLKEIRDADVVKDAIQHLFLYLWDKRDCLEQARNVRSYLIIALLRKLSADWKKSVRHQHLALAWNGDADAPLPTPEEILISRQSQASAQSYLMLHINALPARQRELILLKFYEGLSYEEIVARTGLSYRTIYNKIHEALKKLRTVINKDHPAYGEVMSVLLIWLTMQV